MITAIEINNKRFAPIQVGPDASCSDCALHAYCMENKNFPVICDNITNSEEIWQQQTPSKQQ